jgi:hypothetical protein
LILKGFARRLLEKFAIMAIFRLAGKPFALRSDSTAELMHNNHQQDLSCLQKKESK